MSSEPTIVDRLLHEQSMNPNHDEYRHEVLGRAAAELTHLRAEVERLRGENAGYKAALLEIRTGKTQADNEHPLGEYASMAFRFHKIAKDALTPQQPATGKEGA